MNNDRHVRRLQAEVRFLKAKLEQARRERRSSNHPIPPIPDRQFQLNGLLDLEGRLILANTTALEFAGIREFEVVGKYFWETPWWTHSSEAQYSLRYAIERAKLGRTVEFITTHITRRGDCRDIRFRLSPILDSGGSVVYLLPEGIDITE